MGGSTCTACGRVFGGVKAFDLHREGAFLQIGEAGEGRHCVEPSAKGMTLNSRGQWSESPFLSVEKPRILARKPGTAKVAV